MIIEITTNKDLIKYVLCHPFIYPDISEGVDLKPEDFEPPDEATYISGFIKDRIVGIACVHKFWDGVKYHPNVLPRMRKYSNEFIRRTIDLINEPIYIEIPERLERVALYHGFEEVQRGEKILMRLER